MKDILELKDWLTVSEACKYLSNHGIKSDEPGIYDLVLELKLKLSVDFLQNVWVENQKTKEQRSVLGIFDLSMYGNEWQDVEREREKIGGSKAHRPHPDHESNLGYVELEQDGEQYTLLFDVHDSNKQITLLDAPSLHGKWQYGIRKAELDRFIKENFKSELTETIGEIKELKARITELEQENKRLKTSLERLSKEPKGRRLISYRRLVAGMAIQKYRIPSEIDETTGKTVPTFHGISNIVEDLATLHNAGTLANGTVKEETIRTILKDAFEAEVTGNKVKIN